MRIPILKAILAKEKARDYEAEYREYHGKPEQIKRRAQRNAARRKLGLKHGDGKEADHSKAPRRPTSFRGWEELGTLPSLLSRCSAYIFNMSNQSPACTWAS